MCGIAGIYDRSGKRAVATPLIERMCGMLSHRGPDDEGVYRAGPIALGHRRLSVIDIEGGHEPMSNEDGSLWLVFNGEIYNFIALRDALVKKGHVFKTKSDAEVILHLYEEEREGCLSRLRGMFAFGLWDASRQTLFLARDRVGIKPLHYTLADNKLVFASELKAILECPWVRRELDREALHDYLTLMYIPSPKTILKGVSKLPAGHYMIAGPDCTDIKEYWDIDFLKVSDEREDEIADKLFLKLKETVKGELISDVPLGAFLSGGIDSSAVVSLMAGLQKSPVITNSIGFAEKSFNELAYAGAVAKRFATDHHEFMVEPKVLDVLEKLTWIYDEPFGDSSSIPTYYVSEMARKTVKVALSGDGGDENFAGYPKYLYTAAIASLQGRLPSAAKGVARALVGHVGSRNPWSLKLRNKLDDVYLDPFELYFKITSIFKEADFEALYNDGAKSAVKGYSPKDAFRKIYDRASGPDLVSKLQYLDMKTSLPDEMLVKTDRASAAHGLEVRVPLLDHELMEYVATIPSSLKAKGPTGKYIFKKAMSRDLPPDVLYRKKMGFSIPLQAWLRTDLKAAVEGELFAKNGIIAGLFNADYVRGLWDYTLHNRMRVFDTTDFAHRVWLLFIFSQWYKRFIG